MDNQTIAIIALVVYILVGIIFCFFGNKWLKIILAIYGFIAGFMLAYTLVPMFTSMDSIYVILISVGAGIIGALLFVLLMYAGLFFLGFGAGVLLCLLIVDAFSLNLYEWYVYIPVLVVGCILGSLTLNKRRIFVSLFTAYIGASMLATSIYAIVNGINTDNLLFSVGSVGLIGGNGSGINVINSGSMYTSWLYIGSLLVLFVAGLVVQLAVTSKKRKKA